MPTEGQTLYDYNWSTREIETHTFVEEKALEGATNPRWTVRTMNKEGGGWHLRSVEVGYYHESAELAMKVELTEMISGLPYLEAEVRKAEKELFDMRVHVAQLRNRIEEITGEPQTPEDRRREITSEMQKHHSGSKS